MLWAVEAVGFGLWDRANSVPDESMSSAFARAPLNTGAGIAVLLSVLPAAVGVVLRRRLPLRPVRFMTALAVLTPLFFPGLVVVEVTLAMGAWSDLAAAVAALALEMVPVLGCVLADARADAELVRLRWVGSAVLRYSRADPQWPLT